MSNIVLFALFMSFFYLLWSRNTVVYVNQGPEDPDYEEDVELLDVKVTYRNYPVSDDDLTFEFLNGGRYRVEFFSPDEGAKLPKAFEFCADEDDFSAVLSLQNKYLPTTLEVTITEIGSGKMETYEFVNNQDNEDSEE